MRSSRGRHASASPTRFDATTLAVIAGVVVAAVAYPLAAVGGLGAKAGADLINPQAFNATCKTTDPSSASVPTQNNNYPFGYWWWNGCPTNTRYNHVMTPNTWSCFYN